MSNPDRVNHGPCRYCGQPILYLGALFCSPSCHFSALGAPETLASLRGPRAQPEPVPEPAAEPVLVEDAETVEETVEPEEKPEPVPEPRSMFGLLEPPPDEPPVRRRLYL